MKRFHAELSLMRRRLRAASGFGVPLSNGRVRKWSPFSSCSPNQHCGCCNLERSENRRTHRAQRYRLRRELQGEL